MKKILIVIFVAALFASCKGKSGWSSAEKKAFVESCVSNGSAMGDKAASYCDCMLEKVAAKYPDPNDASKLSTGDMMDWAKECLK